jgi:hypothetical protein
MGTLEVRAIRRRMLWDYILGRRKEAKKHARLLLFKLLVGRRDEEAYIIRLEAKHVLGFLPGPKTVLGRITFALGGKLG